MTTARDVVTDAAYASGALGQGETLSDTDAQLIFRRFGRMLETWANESYMIYDIYVDTLALQPNVGVYSTALLSQGRPVAVDSMYVRNNNIDYPVAMISNQTYGEFSYKIVSAIPDNCWYNSGYPDGSFNFYPLPYAAFTAYISCLRNLRPAAMTLSTVLSFPPGYERAFVDGLGVDICPSFGLQASPDLQRTAANAKRVLKRTNLTPLEMNTGLGVPYPNSNSFIYKGF